MVLRDLAIIKSDIQQLLLRNEVVQQGDSERGNDEPDPMLKLPIKSEIELDDLNQWLASEQNFTLLVRTRF